MTQTSEYHHPQAMPIARLVITMLVIFHTEGGRTADLAGIFDSTILINKPFSKWLDLSLTPEEKGNSKREAENERSNERSGAPSIDRSLRKGKNKANETGHHQAYTDEVKSLPTRKLSL